MTNSLFKRNQDMNNIRQPFSQAKDRAVTPDGAPTSTKKDRVHSGTGAPNVVLPKSYTQMAFDVIPGFPMQKDGTVLSKQPANVRPGPDSMPWWRRDSKNVANGGELIILDVPIPPGRVYRLERIGHTFWSSLDEFWIIYDDKLLNDFRWQYPLGTSVNPFRLPVTVSATKSFKCFVRNNSGQNRLYEFLLVGWFDMIEFQHGSRTS